MAGAGLYRSSRLRVAFLVVCCLAVALVGLSFAVSSGGATPDPIPFEDATAAGLPSEDKQEALDRGATIPRAQVFYSQYQFVVGYYGIEYAVTDFQQPGHDQQFGYPVAVWVSDYTDTGVSLTAEGLPVTETDPGWVQASNAHFVLGSARLPSGETPIPFSSESTAESFAASHGGEVVDWSTLQTREFDIDLASAVRERVDTQRASADQRVQAARQHRDRDVSVVVGEDAPTIQAAIDAAPPGTTILVPEGTYEEKPTIDKPVTLRGEGATIQGDGNGSVVHVESDDVAILGVEITGVGEQMRPDETVGEDDWDEGVETGYGHADAAIQAVNVSGTYVADVHIETPTHGVLLRDSPGVVENSSVNGSEEWTDGFMGVISLRAPVVVQNSTFVEGRDGIYIHRAHNSVIRNNTFYDNRFGVHLMYTSETLIADNVARGQSSAGVVIMTSPSRNAVVGNDVRNARTGIIPGGAYAYVAENVVANNDRGLSTGTSQSLYERNVIYGNDLGIKAGSIRPTNRIINNDIVANDTPVTVGGQGPLRIWSYRGAGNYWDTGTVPPRQSDQYEPSSPLAGQYRTVDGTVTLAASPAATLLDAVRDVTPGLREGSVLDMEPRSRPVNPQILAELEEDDDD
jgi:parallel beta-helix repeat protein